MLGLAILVAPNLAQVIGGQPAKSLSGVPEQQRPHPTSMVEAPGSDASEFSPVKTSSPASAIRSAGQAAMDDLRCKPPVEIGRDVVAARAEDHYARVYTTAGDALILSKFSDVVAALAPLGGLRVHRSWWARTDAMNTVAQSGQSLILTMTTDLEAPVSQACRSVVRLSQLARVIAEE